ncbi:MAG TPA: DUF371 domain-containing protein [Methanobacterium sp.]|jgi:hypothetical protein|nr:MAG: DUF371 domain-containing protein [Methanobacterium sp.]HOI71531.1 DUF371 domain-containing protein [Methanobacterium sp.]HPX77492.1 DUF371 domain-containing protein [Methanobacterium sp.]
MEYCFHAKGHKNVTSLHKTTFEVTRDKEIGKTADCIIGVGSESVLDDLPDEMKDAIRNNNTIITIKLETENAEDTIKGYGHENLTLKHPTDMVCRKSNYMCSRTLMIKADKAAVDLKKELIEDLRDGKVLKVSIIV